MAIEILIVDDNADIRNILNELILDAGYKTRLAANFNQALAEIDKKIPDVAILDVKLDKGDNDGIELLSHIKSKNKDVPVIIISGHANIEMAISSLKHGAFEFIEKPFDQTRLINFIKRAVENLKLKEQNIPTAVHYPTPLPEQPSLKKYRTLCPVAIKASEEVLSLPMHPYLTNENQDIIINNLVKIMNKD